MNLHGFQVDRLPAGSLGSFDLALGPLPPCDAARDDHWLVLRGSDGSCTGAVGNQVVRCACQAGIWNVYTPTSHPGLSIAASRGLSVTGGVVQNVDGDAGIAFESGGTHDATLTDVTFRQPLLDEVVVEPMTRGVWDQSEGGGVGTTNITCDPGAVSGLCVDLSGP